MASPSLPVLGEEAFLEEATREAEVEVETLHFLEGAEEEAEDRTEPSLKAQSHREVSLCLQEPLEEMEVAAAEPES
jgi:hypothetical protein